jgi:hypothetical protein
MPATSEVSLDAGESRFRRLRACRGLRHRSAARLGSRRGLLLSLRVRGSDLVKRLLVRQLRVHRCQP